MQRLRVDVHHDLTALAAIGNGQRRALHHSKLLTDVVEAVVEDLGFGERLAAQSDLYDRDAGGTELHDDRRLYAGRHDAADRLRNRVYLRHGRIDMDVRLEVDLDDADAVKRLRLDVLDVAGVGGDGVFTIGGKPLRHLFRR